jgi:hypothetical protein
MGRIMLYLAGLSFVVIGAISLIEPTAVVGSFGIALATADAASEIRSVYGGFLVALGLFFLLLARRGLVWEGLIGAALVAAGFPAGRLVGLGLDRGHGRFTYVALLIDTSVLAVALVAVAVERRRRRLEDGGVGRLGRLPDVSHDPFQKGRMRG